MNVIVIVLFFIAAFHFCLYYCNMDVFTWAKKGIGIEKDNDKDNDKEKGVESEKESLAQSKEILEKHLKELKQYSTHG